MSSEIEKLAVYDARIVQKRPQFQVTRGGSSISNYRFPAISATTSQLNFTVQAPSVNVYLDRMVTVRAKQYLKFQVFCAAATVATGTAAAVAGGIIGKDWSPCALPLQMAVNTTSATINDATVNFNTQELLPQVLRLVDYGKALKGRTCPTALDRYQSNDVAVGTQSNPCSSYADAVLDYVSNGSFPGVAYTNTKGVALAAGGAAFPLTINGGTPVANGTFRLSADGILQIVASAGGDAVIPNTAGTGGSLLDLYCSIEDTEPIILSPFLYNAPLEMEECGLFGIQNIQLLFNMGSPARVLRSTNTVNLVSNVRFNDNVDGGAIDSSAEVECTFLTPPLSLKLAPKSWVEYQEIVRYTTAVSSLPIGEKQDVNSQTFSLPCIPDYMMIYVKPKEYSSSLLGDFTYPVESINLNFNNVNGLLNNMSKQQLYTMSYRNSLNMDFPAWSGSAIVASATASKPVKTVGGALLIRPAIDFSLGSESLAPGSIGQFNIQFNLRINNNFVDATPSTIYLVCFNAGYFETGPGGQSNIIRGVLTEKDVIQSNDKLADVVTQTEIVRNVGAGMFSKMSSHLGKSKHLMKKKKDGGVLSAGGMSGGIAKKSSRLG